MTIDLTDPIFHDEAKAHEWLEKRRDTGRIIAHLITIFSENRAQPSAE